MDSKTMIEMEFVRTLQQDWNRDAVVSMRKSHRLRISDRQPLNPARIHEAMQRLVQRMRAAAHQVPTRRQTIDWFGRRLITWGWQLRMRYGSHGR